VSFGGESADSECFVDDEANAGAESSNRGVTGALVIDGGGVASLDNSVDILGVDFGGTIGASCSGSEASEAVLEGWLTSRIKAPLLSISSGCDSKSGPGGVISS
jgi:hypothetical protein